MATTKKSSGTSTRATTTRAKTAAKSKSASTSRSTAKAKTATGTRSTTAARATTKAKAPAAKTASAATAKPAPVAQPAPDPVAVTPAAQPETEAPAEITLSKKALLERVKARAGQVRGRDVRVVLDAVLEELGGALAAGETLRVQPLGLLKVQRRKELARADLIVCKLRRKKRGDDDKDPLAEAAE